jgi:hypothetical protein
MDTTTDTSEHASRPKKGSRPSLSRSRWAAIGAAVAVSLGAGGIGLTHAINTNGGNAFVPISPCRLVDTRAASAVGARTSPLGPNETFTQQVTGNVGQCAGIPADATAVALNVTAVDGTAASYLTLFPSEVASPPNASNLNWVPGAPPTPNKVDVKLGPTGAIKIYNNVGSVNVLADVVGYYQDHNHDARYPRKLTIPYSLPAGGVSDPIEIPAEIPVSLTGVNLTSGVRGVGSATLLSIAGVGGFIEWTGLHSTAGSNITQGFDGSPGTDILFIDFSHQVVVEVASPTSIQIHNASAGQRTGNITLTW